MLGTDIWKDEDTCDDGVMFKVAQQSGSSSGYEGVGRKIRLVIRCSVGRIVKNIIVSPANTHEKI